MGELLRNDNGTAAIIIIMAVCVILFAVLIIGRFKRYIDGARAAGDEIMMLARPVKSMISSVICYGLIAYVVNGHGISSGGIDLSSILVLAIGAINISFDIKPQVICEHGIVTSNGLIPWDIIEEIQEINEKDDIVYLRLSELVPRNRDMKVFCPSGESQHAAQLIESRIKGSSN